jgi:hypothetical protein
MNNIVRYQTFESKETLSYTVNEPNLFHYIDRNIVNPKTAKYFLDAVKNQVNPNFDWSQNDYRILHQLYYLIVILESNQNPAKRKIRQTLIDAEVYIRLNYPVNWIQFYQKYIDVDATEKMWNRHAIPLIKISAISKYNPIIDKYLNIGSKFDIF